jgi:hypothetical protein
VFNQPINERAKGSRPRWRSVPAIWPAAIWPRALRDRLAAALNLNEFEIQAQGENGAGPTVMLGQQVGKNLFFRLRQGFGQVQATEFILEYQLRDYLRLQATAAETSGGTQRIQFRRVERGGIDLIFFFAY